MAESSTALPTGPTKRAQAKSNKSKLAGGAGQDREVVKAALASPLTVPWPNIPRHLQRTLLHALPQIVPPEVADYHVSRQRCHRTAKRGKAKEALKAAKAEALAASASDRDGTGGPLSIASGSGSGFNADGNGKRRASSPPPVGQPSKKAKTSNSLTTTRPAVERPTPPEILQHLVLGIHEVLKSLERQISDLRMRIMQMGDALNGQLRKPGSIPVPPQAEGGLLPTAPTDVDLSAPTAPLPPGTRAGVSASSSQRSSSPLLWIFIPLASISPQELVNPIPQYCATYNTLVFQYIHLAKICRSRLPGSRLDGILGKEPEEVRVVPMARIEGEMAELVGLRRLAALGVRASHPTINTLHGLLPKSVLHPPRLSLTLPLPTSALHIYNGHTITSPTSVDPGTELAVDRPPAPAPAAAPPKPPLPKPIAASGAFIHYAPLHVKGITTTVPADGNARKAKRMEEVRARRREVKEKKRLGKMGKKEVRQARDAAARPQGITA